MRAMLAMREAREVHDLRENLWKYEMYTKRIPRDHMRPKKCARCAKSRAAAKYAERSEVVQPAYSAGNVILVERLLAHWSDQPSQL